MQKVKFLVDRQGIEFTIFYLLLFFACVPYIGYGMFLINSGVEVIGGLNQNIAVAGGTGKTISFMKDILTVLLLLVMTTRLERDKAWPLGIFIAIVYYGGFLLAVDGRPIIEFLIAGIRTFMFIVISTLFCKRYYYELHAIKCRITLYKVVFLTLLINTFFVIAQAISSGSLFRLGSGAYRFSGAFPGSGNLGCYAIAVMLFVITIQADKIVKGTVFANILCIFLSVASGTRTCIILSVAVFVYSIIQNYGDKLRISWKASLALAVIFAVMFGSSAISNMSDYIGRGELGISGIGRINIFMNNFNESTAFQIFFGRGLGVGTNAALTMNLENTSVSDSTYNLIFTQFGLIGLIVITVALIGILIKIFRYSYEKKSQTLCFILCVVAMYVVGNLFEHIAMIILIVITYYMIYTDYEGGVEE